MSQTVERYLGSVLTMIGVLLFGFFWPINLRSQQSAGNQESKPLPRFEEFPVTEAWKGPPVPVRLASREERMFRTALREAAKQPPDFAGHYRFAIWGCGTRCVGGAVIDLSTGTVFAPPLGGKGVGEEHWIFCTDWNKEHGAEYRADSRLLVLRCGHEYDEHWDDVHYLVWEQDHFREILHTPGKEF